MLTRRDLISVAVLAAGMGVTPTGATAASGSSAPLRLRAWIDGTEITREELLQWEARRIQVAARRLSQHLVGALLADLDALLRRPALSTRYVSRDRELLADVKLRMGEKRIRQIFAADLGISSTAATLASVPNRWAVSSARVTSSLGTPVGFARWFQDRGKEGDQRAMLTACPDHYLIHDLNSGVQEVIEVTGGAMVASRFVIDYSDAAGLPISRDSGFPVSLSGWARAGQRRIGAVRHQFRPLPAGGFEADLAVAFPATLPPWMVAEHRWHLACEFSNWIAAYTATIGDANVRQ